MHRPVQQVVILRPLLRRATPAWLRALQGDPSVQGNRPGRDHRSAEGGGKPHHAHQHPRGTAELQDGHRLVITGDALYALRLPSNAAVQVRLCFVGLQAVHGCEIEGLPPSEALVFTCEQLAAANAAARR